MGSGPMASVLKRSYPTFSAYAKRHGYDLIVARENRTGRPASWAKVPALLQALGEREYAFWIDADAIVMDDSLDVATVLPADSYQGLVCHEFTNPRRELPNTGVWLLRSDARSVGFLNTVWNSREFIHHDWWENAAVLRHLGYPVSEIDRRVTTEWQAGTFWLSQEWNRITRQGRRRPVRILHYAGVPNSMRVLGMSGDLHERGLSDSYGAERLGHVAALSGWRLAFSTANILHFSLEGSAFLARRARRVTLGRHGHE